jgi:hypothetical protein
MKKAPWIGQYTGVKMVSGNYKICRILEIFLPNVPTDFCGRKYTNPYEYSVFHLDWGGISVPDIFFPSKMAADLWLAKKNWMLSRRN